MTTSGSANFAVSGGDIVRAAYRIVHSVSSEYTLDAVELSDGLQSLNMLVKNLMGPPNFLAKGIKTWQKEIASLTLKSKLDYSIKLTGGDLNIEIPVRILNANYKQTSNKNESPLREMSYEEYFSISDKTSKGTPTRYTYNRKLSEGIFSLNVIPLDSIVTAVDTIEISYLTPIEDFDASVNNPYFPQEWYRPLKWLLAQEMHPEAGRRLPEEVAALANQSIESATSFEEDTSKMFFEPDNPESW